MLIPICRTYRRWNEHTLANPYTKGASEDLSPLMPALGSRIAISGHVSTSSSPRDSEKCPKGIQGVEWNHLLGILVDACSFCTMSGTKIKISAVIDNEDPLQATIWEKGLCLYTYITYRSYSINIILNALQCITRAEYFWYATRKV